MGAFDSFDVMLAAGAGLASGCIAVSLIWRRQQRWLTIPPLLVGIIAAYAIVRRGLMGYADLDRSLGTPEVGAYAALTASAALAVAAGALRDHALK